MTKQKLFVLLLFFSNQLIAQNIPQQNANIICRLFKENKTDSVVTFFSDEVKIQLNNEKLQQVWSGLKQQVGALKNYTQPKNKPDIGKWFYASVFEFESTKLELRLPFNEEGRLIGLFFSPYQEAANYKAPTYSYKGKYTEENFVLESDGLKLKTFFTKPDKKKFPLVILVHGSGPHDADETINNFKPFKDIAIGLAQNGIATLRYEKRTLNYKTDSLSNTPTKEVVIDAVNLYKKALQMPEIDKESIYILGHSLGGLMAPKIAEQCSGLKGIILMAAPANKLEDIILEQYTYILSLDSLDADEKRKLADLKQQVNRVKNNEYNLQTPNEKLPLQISATYWQDLANYKPLQSNFIQTHKVLVLNGGKDYQVTKTDFETWKQTLQNNKQAVFKFYPTLFHLFAIGNATPNDYEQVSNVQEEVITDIVKFIH